MIKKGLIRILVFLSIACFFLLSVQIALADVGQDILNTACKYDGKYNPKDEGKPEKDHEQCKGFVKYVYDEALGVALPSTSSDWNTWDSYEQYGFRAVSIFNPLNIRFEQGTRYTKEYMFTEFCFPLKPGDALQVDGKSDPHTMIYIGTNTDANNFATGILVVEANRHAYNIVHIEEWTLEQLWNYMGGTASNGITAYRYVGN